VHVRHIAAARNAGAAAAVGDTLVFVDADTVVTAPVIHAMLDARRRGAIGGGAVVHFDQPLPRYARSWAAAFTSASRRFGLAAGCFVFCAADAFAAVGGFDERYFAAEEIIFSRSVRRRGTFVILETPVVTSARKIRTHSAGEIWWTFLKLMLPGAVKRRSALPLWYGPRRHDP
jgi:GT2 family glycosyltransferase